MRTLFISALLSLLLSGCTSVPISTAVRMATMDPQEEIANTDPDNIRVRIAMPQGFEPDIDATSLNLQSLTESGEQLTAEMSLSLLHSEQAERSTGFFSSDMAVNSYELALSQDGARQLRKIQPHLLTEGEISFSVDFSFASAPEGAEEMFFWVDIKLSADESYLPLLDAAKLKFNHKYESNSE